MKRFITDLIDDLKCITFTSKAWNYVGLILTVISGAYWLMCSEYGDFFKVTGCILYCAATFNWISKSEWGKFMLDLLK